MKVNRKEIYTLDDLTKEELVFLFEVIDQLKLTSASSPEAHSVAKKFKELRTEAFKSDIELENPSPVTCDGCELSSDNPTHFTISSLTCPLEHIGVNLCPTCYEIRQNIALRLKADG